MTSPNATVVPPLESGPELLRQNVQDQVFETGVRRRTITVVTGDTESSILGRLHAAREIVVDLAGIARLASIARQNRTAQPWTIDGDVFVSFRGGMRPLLHHGDLHIRGSLLIDDHAWLVITGDLIVDGIVSNHQPSTLAVGGHLSARNLVTNGNVVVGGSVTVESVALVRGTTPLVAGVMVSAPKLVHEGANVIAPTLIVERSVDLEDDAQRELHRARFAPEALTESGEIDPERCDRIVRCGLSLFR